MSGKKQREPDAAPDKLPSQALEDKAVQEITKRTVIPEALQPLGYFEILEQKVKTRPLPNHYSLRLFDLASPVLTVVSEILTVDASDIPALVKAQADMREKDPNAEHTVNNLLLEATKVICEAYGISGNGKPVGESLRERMTTGEMLEVVRNQVELNGVSDFLLQPLRLIFGMFGVLTYLMSPTAVRMQEIAARATPEPSPSPSGPSQKSGDSPPSD